MFRPTAEVLLLLSPCWLHLQKNARIKGLPQLVSIRPYKVLSTRKETRAKEVLRGRASANRPHLSNSTSKGGITPSKLPHSSSTKKHSIVLHVLCSTVLQNTSIFLSVFCMQISGMRGTALYGHHWPPDEMRLNCKKGRRFLAAGERRRGRPFRRWLNPRERCAPALSSHRRRRRHRNSKKRPPPPSPLDTTPPNAGENGREKGSALSLHQNK